jgi:predicted Zn-dependent protease
VELDKEKVGPRAHFDATDNSWMFKDIHWQLVNSKTVNAFTTGGHYDYIYLELFKMCKSEDELAAVLAHEYGHIYCRHVQKGGNRQEALAGLSLVAGGAGYLAGGQESGAQYSQSLMQAAKAGGGFLDMGFTRDDEAQADDFGFKFYTRAGWDPQHFGDFFKDMIAAGYDKGSALTSDHPTLKSRVEAAEKRVQAQNRERVAKYRKPPIADQAQFDAAKAQAIQVAQGLPDDQKVLQAKNLLQALPRSCWVPYEPDDQKQAQQAIIDQAQKQQEQQAKQQPAAK